MKFISGGPAVLAMLKCRSCEVPLAFCPAVTGGLAFTDCDILLYTAGAMDSQEKSSVIVRKFLFHLKGLPEGHAMHVDGRRTSRQAGLLF